MPLDDVGRSPGRCTAEVPVWRRHLTTALVRGHRGRGDAEIGGHVSGHPPVGVGVRLGHVHTLLAEVDERVELALYKLERQVYQLSMDKHHLSW